MNEEWRDIKGYEGKYQVSNLGRVKSLNYNREKILKPRNSNGYLRVELHKKGKGKNCLVHRLVAEAFIENPNNYPIINHKDENPSNNIVSNLEWCTYKHNNNYGTHNKRVSNTRKHKGLSKGKNNPKSRKVQCVTTGRKFNYIQEASEYYNIDRAGISKCCRGKLKSAGKHPVTGEKLVWKYIEEVL